MRIDLRKDILGAKAPYRIMDEIEIRTEDRFIEIMRAAGWTMSSLYFEDVYIDDCDWTSVLGRVINHKESLKYYMSCGEIPEDDIPF